MQLVTELMKCDSAEASDDVSDVSTVTVREPSKKKARRDDWLDDVVEVESAEELHTSGPSSRKGKIKTEVHMYKQDPFNKEMETTLGWWGQGRRYTQILLCLPRNGWLCQHRLCPLRGSFLSQVPLCQESDHDQALIMLTC